MPAPIERRTMRKVYIRLLPFAFALYLICYLDRANIGFAALTMNRDLGFSAYVYGLGAGAFFWGYFLLEVPSNLILERVGARRWIARIMITWGIVSGCFAFVQGPITFFTLRFLLGLAEAGFFPGMILYFTYWFPPYHRARVVAGFMAAIPVSIGLGAPVSTALLGLDGMFGLAGWKWLFLAEAVPAVLLGIAVLFYLTDNPAVANWLEPDERQWLGAVMAEEKRLVDADHRVSVWQSLIDRRVLTLGFIHFRSGRRQRQHRSVRGADDQATRPDQYANRLGHGDPFRLRHDRHPDLGSVVGPDEREAMEPRRSLPVHGYRLGSGWCAARQLLVNRRFVAGHGWALCRQRPSVPDSLDVSYWRRRRQRYRLDQFAGYPRRRGHVSGDRLDQGLNGQLCRRPLFPRCA